jgi:hypothetical protein
MAASPVDPSRRRYTNASVWPFASSTLSPPSRYGLCRLCKGSGLLHRSGAAVGIEDVEKSVTAVSRVPKWQHDLLCSFNPNYS